MAEAVVGVLICKLSVALENGAAAYGASLLCKEAFALKGLFREIRKAEGELHVMKDYLHDAEKLKDTNITTGIFVKKIRDLAFRIEDVIDEFMYKQEDEKHGSFLTKIKKRVNHVKIWRSLALELCEINAELEDAARKRGVYDMQGAERYDGGSSHHARSSLCLARDEDLVAIEDNADKLKRWLVGDLEERYKIITVWGMGGVGKTTLVEHVYKIVKEDFDIAAWVTVSKSFQVEDLLKKIAREFGVSVGDKNMEMRSLVEAIRNHLKVSLEDLPYELKNCFLHCAIFPEDCEMYRRRLIRQWITARPTHLRAIHAFMSNVDIALLRPMLASSNLLSTLDLQVSDVTSELSVNLCSAITSMCHLAHLSVTASNENEVLPWEALRLPETLFKLDLGGQLEKKRLPQILSPWSHLKNLARLTLIGSKLDEDSFPSLVVLSGLCLLELDKAYNGKKLYFPALSFPRLRRLDILGPLHLDQVEISDGALENLGELVFAKCPELKLLPHGIENLTSLEELHLYDIAEELVDKLRQKTEANQFNEELTKISHIKKVVVRLTEKNIQERIR
ncbi:hypothetical protein HU200_016835 [Digitaria exilis]|uniref:Uncharacterized protein n=1 Tax=Digitaria exilis TaxID=1010633 RepID=A0A835KJN6_9POAL|nr:hypothetical protein HU200_016835 [Digitaria exilis]